MRLAPGGGTTKLFTEAIVATSKVFATAIHFHSTLTLAGKARAYQSGRLLALPPNRAGFTQHFVFFATYG